jgi:hypothetical protein
MPNQQTTVADSPWGKWFWVAILGLLLYSQYAGQGGCTPIIGQQPPYLSPTATFLVLEDATPEGRQKLLGEQLDILTSNADDGFTKTIEAAGGKVEILDYRNTVDESSAAWVKLAFPLAKKDELPTIVASSPRRGIAPQKLPLTLAEAKALALPVLAK